MDIISFLFLVLYLACIATGSVALICGYLRINREHRLRYGIQDKPTRFNNFARSPWTLRCTIRKEQSGNMKDWRQPSDAPLL